MMLNKLFSLLGNRYAGFVLCLLVVANLIVGSLVMHFNPDIYPSFQYLDLPFFFQPVMGVHFWLYALLLTFALFGINLFACIVKSIMSLLANGGGLKASAALLFHVALLSTMAAHLVEGVYATTQRAMLNEQGAEIDGIGQVRLESMSNVYYPDNSLKNSAVKLQIERPNGSKIDKEISYNSPAIFDYGLSQLGLLRGQSVPTGVVIVRDGDVRPYRLMPSQPLPVHSGSLMLQGLVKSNTGMLFARIAWLPNDGNPQHFFMGLDASEPHYAQIEVAGATYRFKEIVETSFIIATVRHNPALPLIVLSLALAMVAILLLVVWLRGRARANVQA